MAGIDTSVSKADIDLCFRALGLPDDASPERVDLAYEAFMARSRRNLQTVDPVKQATTMAEMESIAIIHFKIKKSVTADDRKIYAGSQFTDSGGISIGMFATIASAVTGVTCGVWYLLT